jgi:hypothetical protein
MHSPFRSESDVFKGALLVLCGIGAAVLIGALTDASWGAVAAGVLIGIAIGFTIRAGRGSLPSRLEAPSSPGDGAHRVLVLANQTVEGEALMSEVRARKGSHERLEVLVVSPSVPSSRLKLIASDTDEARHDAQERLERSLAAFSAAGISSRGMRGDEDPVQAAADAMHDFPADEIIVSTLPPGASRWIERDVVGALRERADVPVAHVTAAAGASGGNPVGRVA